MLYEKKYLKYKNKYLILKKYYKCSNPNADVLNNICKSTNKPTKYLNKESCTINCLKDRSHIPKNTIKEISKFNIRGRSSGDASGDEVDMAYNEWKKNMILNKIEFKPSTNYDTCIIVLQGEIALSSSDDKNPILCTYGLGPCHGISIYNRTNKKGLLMHIDAITGLNIFHNIYEYLEIVDVNNIDINIISGQGYDKILNMIYKKLNVMKLLDRVVGTSIGENNTIMTLDTNTGYISDKKCNNFKDKSIDESKIIVKKELYKTYGFDSYEETDNISWYDKEDIDIDLTEGLLELIFNFPEENKDNTFDNYIINEENREVFNYSKKFAHQVASKTLTDSSYYFLLFGDPGIGKTFLSVSIAKYVYNRGKNVLFVNSHELGNYFQESRGDFKKVYELFDRYLYDKDLVIIDDLTSKYDITGHHFLNKVKEYIEMNGKSLLITSNINISEILNDYVEVLNYNKKNVLIYNLNIKKSARESWIDNISPVVVDNSLELLANYNELKPAGIVIINDINNRDILEYYKTEYLKHDKNPSIKIRLTEEPYNKKGVVHDYYVHNIKEFDVVITKVNNLGEAGQFIKIINNIYNNKLKLIIITNSLETLKTYVSKELNSYLIKPYKQRYIDRLNVITPSIEYD